MGPQGLQEIMADGQNGADGAQGPMGPKDLQEMLNDQMDKMVLKQS